MRNKKKNFFRLAISSLLCTGFIFSNPGITFASEEYDDYEYQEEVADPTPTPDPHSEYYYQEADTDSISGWPTGPKIEAESAVLMDLTTNTILYSKNADKKQYPASITKIMTALLGCENLDPNADMVISQSAAYGIEVGSSSIYADTGEEFTIHEALMAVMLESANEMSLAIAEEVSGSSKKFVELMNERAALLGCTNTHFNNPNGLPDETHYTTANDMAKIAAKAWNNPLFRTYTTTQYFEIPPTNIQPETRYFLNHHRMMLHQEYAYDGVVGGKTGYTQTAGSTLVTYAERDNRTLMAVVLRTTGGGYSDTAALLDYGFNNFEKKNMKVKKETGLLQQLPSEKYILKDNGNTYPFSYQSKVYVTVPAGTDIKTLDKKQTLVKNAAGPLILQSTWYFQDHPVGTGQQYEKEILSDLLQ